MRSNSASYTFSSFMKPLSIRDKSYILCSFLTYHLQAVLLCHLKSSKRHPPPRNMKDNKKTPWPEYASKLYRPNDRRLSTKLVPTFADRGVSRSQRSGSLPPYSQIWRPEPLLFLSSSSSIVLTRLNGRRFRPGTS
jgi:hypothetical protein